MAWQQIHISEPHPLNQKFVLSSNFYLKNQSRTTVDIVLQAICIIFILILVFCKVSVSLLNRQFIPSSQLLLLDDVFVNFTEIEVVADISDFTDFDENSIEIISEEQSANLSPTLPPKTQALSTDNQRNSINQTSNYSKDINQADLSPQEKFKNFQKQISNINNFAHSSTFNVQSQPSTEQISSTIKEINIEEEFLNVDTKLDGDQIIINRSRKRIAILEEYCAFKSSLPTVDSISLYNSHFPNKWVNHKIFMSRDFKFTFCLPLKTGTTNWQRAFLRNLNPNVKPHELKTPALFSKLPRISDLEDSLQEITLKRTDYVHGINVRHPFSRLFSAYNQKFKKSFYTRFKKMFSPYGNIMMKIDKKRKIVFDRDEYVASFESFLRMIARVKHDRYFDMHWKTYYRTCSPCKFSYNFISHTETATEDSGYILKKIFKKNVTIEAPYNPKKTFVKQLFNAMDPDLIQAVYSIYEDDFKMFGYSLDDNF